MADVIVYSTPTCPYCIKLKEFLDKEGIDFKNVDVSTNQEGAKEMVEKTGQRGVPVTVIGDEFVVGFDKDKIMKILED